ncbi:MULTISPECIES: hypothetical protein [unclassified Mesorhizobium]|uniref:hypothetical protein n=1 Tax=unclassified Mesorhizobium TaxID=325217 RepID=UPI00333A7513
MMFATTMPVQTSSTMTSQGALALLAALAQCATPLSSAHAQVAPRQILVTYERSDSSYAPRMTVRAAVEADELLASDLNSFFRKLASAQTDVEEEFLPALYDRRSDFYTLL